MPHKVASKKAIKSLEEAIAYYDRSIENIRGFRKGKDGLKNALLVLKDVRDELGKAVDNCLGNPNHVRQLRAISYQGERRGIQKAIDLFEDPDSQLSFFKSQKALAVQALKQLEEMPAE
mgnify:CR=1 FL=1